MQELIRFFESKGVRGLWGNLSDDRVHYEVRQKGTELIGELGLLEAI